MKKAINSIKYLQLYDLLSVFIFIMVLPISILYKIYIKSKKKRIWLICEEGKNARDNGYQLFKYIRKEHPELDCYYVIDYKSKDYSKVKEYGNIINFRSFKHWLYYLTAEYNISSQKNGNPAQPLFYFIHVYLNLYNNRVFLQHGITKDLAEWLFYKNTKFRYFICGAKEEYEYIKNNFGYPSENVKYIGFARFDNLHDFKTEKNTILVMPTWRNWLGRETNMMGEKINFKETEYFKKWNSFLNSKELDSFLKKYDLKLLFYPHINMQKYLNCFNISSNNVELIDTSVDIQNVLKKSAVMITDYSSVYMDFAYMRKPIIYYHFDYSEYRKNQYQQGYFDYKNDGFGPICNDINEIVKELNTIYDNDMKPEAKYYKRMSNFFELYDNKNCERHYELLINHQEKVKKNEKN